MQDDTLDLMAALKEDRQAHRPPKPPPNAQVQSLSSPNASALISSKLAYKGRVFNVFTDTRRGARRPSPHPGRHPPQRLRRHARRRRSARTPTTPTSSSSASTATPPASTSSNFPPAASTPANAPRRRQTRADRRDRLPRRKVDAPHHATSPAPASSASGCRSTSPATSAKATATPELDENIEIIRMPLSEAMRPDRRQQNPRRQDPHRPLSSTTTPVVQAASSSPPASQSFSGCVTRCSDATRQTLQTFAMSVTSTQHASNRKSIADQKKYDGDLLRKTSPSAFASHSLE